MSSLVEEEFAPAKESISWAEDATAELCSMIDAFFKNHVAKIVVEMDPKTGENVQKLKFLAHIPKDFRRKATEALNNARHSFDQSVFAARNLLSTRSSKGVNFPWSRDPTDLEQLLATRGVDARLWDILRSHEPYGTSDDHPGGDDLIRTLATVANNKHTVGLAANGHVTSTGFPNITFNSGMKFEILNPRWDPRKNEVELVRWQGDLEMDGDYNFEFIVCLKDARLAPPVDVVYALRVFTAKSQSVHDSIKAKCLELAK